MLNETINDLFEYKEKLGEGAAGTVHKALLLRNWNGLEAGISVCIKSYKDEIFKREERHTVVARRIREVNVAVQLKHPNLVSGYDAREFWIDDSPRFLVLDYVDGKTIKEITSNEIPLPTDDVFRIFFHLSNVLSYLHDHGYIHRDVKPANIIIRSNGEPVLLDLGVLSDEVEACEYTGSQVFLGTLRFAAPEWILAVDCTHATDVYSLGTVLFQILTGKQIFSETLLYTRLVNAVQHEKPKFPPHLKEDPERLFLTILCEKMLLKDPKKRPSISEIVAFNENKSTSSLWNSIRCEVLISLFRSDQTAIKDSLLNEVNRCDLNSLDKLISKEDREQIITLGRLQLLLKPSSIQEPVKCFLSLDVGDRAEWLKLLFEGIHGEEGYDGGSAIEGCWHIANEISKSYGGDVIPQEVMTLLEEADESFSTMWREIALENAS